MWVRSQDRLKIMDAKMFEIDFECSIFGYCYSKGSYLLGEYHDADEAMDVINEIMEHLNGDDISVYEMPVSQYYEGSAKDDGDVPFPACVSEENNDCPF